MCIVALYFNSYKKPYHLETSSTYINAGMVPPVCHDNGHR